MSQEEQPEINDTMQLQDNNSNSDEESKENKEQKPIELLTHPAYEKLMQDLDAAEKKNNDHWQRILRMQADFENATRRAERDLANAHKYALEKFITELLPIIDSLELCINNATDHKETSIKALIEGVKLTLKMFYSALEKFG